MIPKARGYLLLLLQLAVTAAALSYVLHASGKRAAMAEALRHMDWRWASAAIGAYGAVELLAAVRWWLLLGIQGFRLRWLDATAILFVGEFFTTFTPGLVGGDAMRILYLARDSPERKMDAFIVVLMDRIMGMLSLICLALAIVALRWQWLTHSPICAQLTRMMLVILAVSAAALLLAALAARLRGLASWPIPRQLAKMGDAVRQYGTDWRRSLGAFVTTLAAQFFYYVSFCWSANALSNPEQPGPGFWAVFSVMPIVNTLTNLPISFGGLGLRESLFQTLLHELAGTPQAVGVLIGAIGFGIRLLWALPGAAAFVFYRFPRDHAGAGGA